MSHQRSTAIPGVSSMRFGGAWRGALAVIASMLLAAPVSAGTSKLVPTLIPLVQPASTSTGTESIPNLGWAVTLTNKSTSNMSGVWFKISTDPATPFVTTVMKDPTDPTGKRLITSDTYCTRDDGTATGNAVTCFVGQIAARGGSVTFNVVYRTPLAAADGSFVIPTIIVPTGQGPGGVDPGSSADAVVLTTAEIAISTSPSASGSYLLPGDSGAGDVSAKVGSTQIAQAGNFKVTVPAVAVASILNTQAKGSCSSMFKACFETKLNVNGAENFFDDYGRYLYVTLIRKPQTLSNNANILNLNGTISADDQGALNACDAAPSLAVPYKPFGDALRCYIAPAQTPPANPYTFVDGDGNWHITLVAKKNLVIKW